MTKVLVLGSDGCLGKALTSYLKNNNYEVFSIPKKSYVDINNKDSVLNLVKNTSPKIIYNLTTSYKNDFERSYCFNVNVTKILLESVIDLLIPCRVILIGSSSEYGFVKDQDKPVKESAVLNPVSIYGLTKSWQTLLAKYFYSKGVDVLIARIFNLYGEGMSENLMVGNLFNQIQLYKKGLLEKITLGNLSDYRDYLSVSEASKILEKISVNGNAGEIYHVCSGRPILLRDFVLGILKENDIDQSALEEKDYIFSRKSVKKIYGDLTKTNKILY